MTAASSESTVATSVGWDGGELVLTRVYAAPRELVFRAWTDAGHFARWWGPRGASLPFCRLDARPGGTLHYRHSFPDYPDVWVAGTYVAVDAPGLLSYRVHFSDETGARVERPGFPGEMTITVTLDEHPQGTQLTIRHVGLDQDRGEVEGWTDSLDRLAELLADHPNHTQDDR